MYEQVQQKRSLEVGDPNSASPQKTQKLENGAGSDGGGFGENVSYQMGVPVTTYNASKVTMDGELPLVDNKANFNSNGTEPIQQLIPNSVKNEIHKVESSYSDVSGSVDNGGEVIGSVADDRNTENKVYGEEGGEEEESDEEDEDEDEDEEVEEEESEDDSDYESHLKEIVYEEVPAELDTGINFEDGDPPVLNEIRFTKKTITQARNFLRSMGHHKFLDALVHSGPTPNDILLLVKLLGYTPRVKRLKNSQMTLESSIYFLQEAIIKVQKKRARLPDFNSIPQLCAALEEAKNILVLTGAGISTSLGIPDFRSSQGFYAQMASLGLDDPQDVFSMSLFKRDPSVFYSIAHMILPPDNQYTPLHAFIKLLQDKGKLLRNYTQNIDNLESTAGIESQKLVQCHGSFATASCVTCKYKVPGETLFPNLRNREIAYCPFCAPERKTLLQKLEKMEDQGIYKRGFDQIQSFGVMKPDITFFGEDLPDRFHDTIVKDARDCDLLICIGTSLKVAPVSDIVNRISENTPQILINRDPINHSEFDIEMLGFCDQAITWLCGKELNWDIPHPDFEKILNSDLEMKVVDENLGVYSITDGKQRENEVVAKKTIGTNVVVGGNATPSVTPTPSHTPVPETGKL